MMTYTVVLLAEQDGRYSAFVPALPGALSWGDTIEEALANIAEAIEGLLEAMREDGATSGQPSAVSFVVGVPG